MGDISAQKKASRVAGPKTLHFAPVMDCSMLDTWLSALYTDCSVVHAKCPVLAADFAVPNTSLHARTQIAPRSTPDARTVRRLLRARYLALDVWFGLLRSSHHASCAGCGSLRSHRFAPSFCLRIAPLSTRPPCSAHRLLRGLPSALRAAHGFLHARHLALAPFADCSALDTWRFVLHADCSAFHTWRPVLDPDRSAFNT